MKRLAACIFLMCLGFEAQAFVLEIVPDKEAIQVGDSVIYTATVTNDSGQTQTDLVGTVYFLFDSATLVNSPANCSLETTSFTNGDFTHLDCPIVDLAAGASDSFQFTAAATELNHFTLEHMGAGMFLNQDGTQIDNLRDDVFVTVFYDTTTDSDSDGVSDFNEELTGSDPGNPGSVPDAAIIDVLVLYTPGAVVAADNEVEARIDHLIQYSNLVLSNSGINASLRLRHAEEVNYTDATTDDVALDALDNGDGVFADVQTLRTQVGADLVTLLRAVQENSPSCGFGNIRGFQTSGDLSSPSDAEFATSVLAIDCPDNTMIHEMGHNLGLNHSRRQNGEGATFPFALGHGVEGAFVTIMAYASAFNLFTSDEIDLFASDALDCDGLPCGVDREDEVDGADAVYTLNTVVYQAANYFTILDFDQDGDPDETDPDDDNDGVLDGDDAFPLDASESVDTDGDNIGNNADLDDDNDNFSDLDELAAGTDPLDVLSFPVLSERLDLDADGNIGALTDGVMLLRYMFNFRGTTMTEGALGPACQRCEPAEIEAHISTKLYDLESQ